MGKIPERSIFDSQPNVRENNIVSVAHCMYWIWLVYSRSHSSQQYKSSITCGNSFSLNFHQNKKNWDNSCEKLRVFRGHSFDRNVHRRKSRQWKEWQLLIDALGFSFSVIVLSMCVCAYTRVTRIRFFEYLLFCSVEVFDDAVLEDCRRSSIQLFVRFDVAFIELLAVVVPLLLPIDVLDALVTIVLSQLLALLFVLVTLLVLLLLVLFAVLLMVFVSFTFE